MIPGNGIEKDAKSDKKGIDCEEEGTRDLLESESNESNQTEDHVKYKEDEPRVLETVCLLICLILRDVRIKDRWTDAY